MKSIAALHVAKKQLALDDDTYRALNLRIVGKASSKDMSEPERQLVLDEMRRRGFKPASKGASNGTRKRLTGQYAPKMQALWIAGWNLGVVTNPVDEALIAFVKRQTGLDNVRFLHDAGDAYKAIETLKQWLTRAANVHWSVDRFLPDWANKPHGQIALAQWPLIAIDGLVDGKKLSETAWSLCGHTGNPQLNDLTDREWQTVMNALGKLVREVK